MDEVRFLLPLPPSVNALYATNWTTKRRFESKSYEKWKADAYAALLTTSPRPRLTPGVVVVTYTLGRPSKRRMDVENRAKALGDFLVAHRLIEDDADIDVLTLRWTDDHPGQVEITIKPWSQP